MRVTLKPL